MIILVAKITLNLLIIKFYPPHLLKNIKIFFNKEKTLILFRGWRREITKNQLLAMQSYETSEKRTKFLKSFNTL